MLYFRSCLTPFLISSYPEISSLVFSTDESSETKYSSEPSSLIFPSILFVRAKSILLTLILSKSSSSSCPTNGCILSSNQLSWLFE